MHEKQTPECDARKAIDHVNNNPDAYPFHKTLGLRLAEWKEGYAVFEARIERHLYNSNDMPHGGVYASMLDSAMGFSGTFTLDAENRRVAVTLSLTTNFIARPTGNVLIAEGRRVGGGKSTFFTEGRLTDNEGNLIATASGTFKYLGGRY